MRIRALVSQSTLGVLIVVHALAHSVLPLRGWMDPADPRLSIIPRVLYSVAVVALTIAGLGLLRVPGFRKMTQPALVLGAAYSLVLLGSSGNPLWPAVLVDIVLLIVGVSRAYQHLPRTEARRSLPRRTARGLGIAVLIYGACAVVLWPVHRQWGSIPEEHTIALPGDPGDRRAALELQHAVTVSAPPEAVWPWLVQLGQDRAGFYSYDWLERAFGVDVRNVKEIRPEWQQRQAGDRIRATQPDYLGGVLGRDLGWTVTHIEPGRAMVLQHWGAFVLEPLPNGHTRFIIRTKVGDPRTPAWAAPLDMMLFELPHFIMERRMMLQIKALSEANGATRT
jgi:hypothetical protein